MGMPAFFYRVYYRAHSLKSLKRNILEGRKEARAGWLTRLSALGAQGR